MASEITARFPGSCRTCGGAIKIGETILWAKATGSRHLVCPVVVRETPARPTRGGYRPYGSNGICTRCGDDCGGTAWSCGYE